MTPAEHLRETINCCGHGAEEMRVCDGCIEELIERVIVDKTGEVWQLQLTIAELTKLVDTQTHFNATIAKEMARARESERAMREEKESLACAFRQSKLALANPPAVELLAAAKDVHETYEAYGMMGGPIIRLRQAIAGVEGAGT